MPVKYYNKSSNKDEIVLLYKSTLSNILWLLFNEPTHNRPLQEVHVNNGWKFAQ